MDHVQYSVHTISGICPMEVKVIQIPISRLYDSLNLKG